MNRDEVEAQYRDYIEAMNLGSLAHPTRAHMPHCDDLVLHAPTVCAYCDGFPDLQEARRTMRIAFTGSRPTIFERPCPATLLRSLETIERWHGNVSMNQDQIEEYQRRYDEALRQVREEFERDHNTQQRSVTDYGSSRTFGHYGMGD